jgi:hypothetical protein
VGSYSVTVTREAITKTLNLNGTVYSEVWQRTPNGNATWKTTGPCIVFQLEEAGLLDCIPVEVVEGIENEDFLILMDYFSGE